MGKRKNRILAPERRKAIIQLLKSIGVTTKNLDIYDLALTHKSFTNENYSDLNEHNERLEFLGDSVLALVITHYIYNEFDKKSEGFLTKLKSKIVSRKNFAKVSRKFDLGDHILLSKGEIKSSGMNRDSILANSFEALLGAIYLDKGFEFTKKIIENIFVVNIRNIIEKQMFKDYKSELQEYFMRNFNAVPEYIVEKEEGDDHSKTFFICVTFQKDIYGKGQGKNKKEAAQSAAFDALKKLKLIQA